MRARSTQGLPARLEGARRRFERWRRTRKTRSRIPDPLWASAVKAAGKYGIHRTAKVLRVDYYALKERVEAVGPQVEASAPCGKAAASRGASDRKAAPARGQSDRLAAATFVELAPPLSGSVRECILELEAPGGAKMRVHLKGVEAPDLAALTQSFWGIEA